MEKSAAAADIEMRARSVMEQVIRTRAVVQWALSEQSSVVGSPAGVFSGKAPGQREILSIGRSDAGLSATRVHAVASVPQKRAIAPNSSGFAGAPVRRAIKSLPGHYQLWIMRMYAPHVRMEHTRDQALKLALWSRYSDAHIAAGTHADTRCKVQLLFLCQLREAANFSRWCLWDARRPRELYDAISASSWTQRYAAHWQRIRDFLVIHDQAALLALASELPAPPSSSKANCSAG